MHQWSSVICSLNELQHFGWLNVSCDCYNCVFQVACELNAALLAADNKESSPKLVGLLKLLLWAQDELDTKKVKFPRLTDLARGTLEDPKWRGMFSLQLYCTETQCSCRITSNKYPSNMCSAKVWVVYVNMEITLNIAFTFRIDMIESQTLIWPIVVVPGLGFMPPVSAGSGTFILVTSCRNFGSTFMTHAVDSDYVTLAIIWYYFDNVDYNVCCHQLNKSEIQHASSFNSFSGKLSSCN